MNVRHIVFVLSFLGCTWMWFAVVAQDVQPAAQESAKVVPDKQTTPKDLRDDALAISGRYARFERMLSQMADILGRQDPERADLLRRAIGKGREDQVREDIEKVVELLSASDLGTATEKQMEVVTSLQTLLKLLQSEDRRSSVERERERLNGLLKDVRNVLAEQKSARAATQNSEAPLNAAPGQQKALNETDALLESMKQHDNQQAPAEQGTEAQKSMQQNTEPGQDEPKDGKPQDAQREDNRPERDKEADDVGKSGQPADGKLKNEDTKNADPKKGSGEKTSEDSKSGSPKSGKQASGKPPEQKPTPGREQLEKAREQMEQALEQLKEQERKEALQHEDKAIEELHAAAAKLEETLKQLREEEKEMLLASLEARFQRMLMAETQIQEGTVSLAATPQKDWLDQYYGRCRELAQQQSELTVECAQTVNLLREDGTSVSILLAVEDIETDMGTVSGWLQESKVGELTQSVQNDILESLKQLIETTQKEMQEMKEQQEQQDQQQKGSEQKPALVELMAEIRMLRNLQFQVNRRTKQVDSLLQSASTDDLPSLRKQIHDLAVRQRRLIETAKELARQSSE